MAWEDEEEYFENLEKKLRAEKLNELAREASEVGREIIEHVKALDEHNDYFKRLEMETREINLQLTATMKRAARDNNRTYQLLSHLAEVEKYLREHGLQNVSQLDEGGRANILAYLEKKLIEVKNK